MFATPALICWSKNIALISSFYWCFHNSQIFVTPALICWSENDTVISSLYLCFHNSRIYNMTLVLMCWSENDTLTYSLYWCFPNMQISVTLALMYWKWRPMFRLITNISETFRSDKMTSFVHTRMCVCHTAMMSCILNFRLTWLHACAFK